MAAFEVNVASTTCRRCGMAYSRLKGYFPVSYSYLYKGTGYLPYCRDCIDSMFNDYYAVCGDVAMSVRQMCRKLDLYWNLDLFEQTEKQSSARSIMTSYLSKLSAIKYAGKSYDDTLEEEGCLWRFGSGDAAQNVNAYGSIGNGVVDDASITDDVATDVSPEIIAFWGPGYTPKMYSELQERYDFFVSGLPDGVELDVGTKTLIRQIAAAELDINKDRAAGKSVDKKQTALNTLLNNSLLKPAQKSDDNDSVDDNTPFGVWTRRWEDQRPIPEVDEDLRDVDGIVKYITVWFLGHLCKMLGIRNSYCKLYEEEISKLRVDRPEYDEEDDEELFNDIFGSVEMSMSEDDA